MSGMAEALAAWNFDREQGEGEWRHCPERAKPGWLKEAQETLDFLAAAGFGPVKEIRPEPQKSCPTRLMDGRNEIRCWLTAGHEGDCK